MMLEMFSSLPTGPWARLNKECITTSHVCVTRPKGGMLALWNVGGNTLGLATMCF